MIQTLHREDNKSEPDTAESNRLARPKRLTVYEDCQTEGDAGCEILKKVECSKRQSQGRGGKTHQRENGNQTTGCKQ